MVRYGVLIVISDHEPVVQVPASSGIIEVQQTTAIVISISSTPTVSASQATSLSVTSSEFEIASLLSPTFTSIISTTSTNISTSSVTSTALQSNSPPRSSQTFSTMTIPLAVCTHGLSCCIHHGLIDNSLH